MLNVLIVGLGNIGHKRFKLISKNKFFNVVGLVDKKFTADFKRKNKSTTFKRL